MNNFLKYSLIALPVLVGGYIVYRQLKPKKDKADETPTPTPTPTPIPTTITPSGGGGSSTFQVRDSFPLKKGSRGAKVKELQGYILKIDKNALPRFGADGDFGNETEGALQMLFGKQVVNSQAELNEIKNKSLPIVKAGSPLVYQYQQPTNVSPFLNIPNTPIK